MRGVSVRTTLWTSALAVALAWTAIGSAATTRVTPASGKRGTHAVLVGSGFRAHKTVAVSLGGVRVGTLKADGHGAFRLRFDVPGSTGLHAKRLVASDKRRSVANRFTITRRSPPLSSSMSADSGGTRLRLSPVAGQAGTSVHVAGWGFPHGGLVRVFFGPDLQRQRAATSRGQFGLSFAAPDMAPGRHAVSARSSGASLSAPFRLRSSTPPPNDKGSWTTRAKMPDRILDSGSAVIGHDLYAVGGKINGDDHQKTLYVYHASTNSWSKGPDLPGVGIENPAATARNGKLFVFGGSTSAFSGAVANAAVYDPGTNKWTVLKPMPSGRAGATAQALGGKIYVIGGMDGSGHSLASVAVYDVANDSWSSGPTLTTPRDNPGSAVLADSDGMDKIFVFGGRNRGTTDILASVEVLDGGTWKSQSPMPTARRTMAVGMLNGNAQLIGGERPPGGGAFDENEEYEPSNDSWRTLAAEPTGRHGTAYGTIGGKVYVIGGATGTQATSYQDVNEVFSFGS